MPMTRLIAVLLCLVLMGPAVFGARAQGRETGESTGLPVPRFVSLRADEVNLRAGPGLRYPVEWVFRRRGLPVEVVDEFKAWRQIRAWDGTLGWVHAVMLQGKRSARVQGEAPRMLLAEPTPEAGPVALVQPGAIGALERCVSAYCRVDFGDHTGWLPRDAVYGVYNGETLE